MLPFVVEPRRKPIIELIGSDESGKIEVQRKGYLTTGEKAFVQQVQQADNGTTEIITLSRRIAREYSLGMDKAYHVVLGIVSGVEIDKEVCADKKLLSEIEERYSEELSAVIRGLAASQTREDLVFAACILRYRVDSNFDISSVTTVHPDLIAELAALYRDEERRSIEAFLDEEDKEQKQLKSVEEIEKKPRKTSSSPSKNTTGD